MVTRVLSMEVGQATTRIVEMDYGAKLPKIYSAFTMETPKDMVSDGVITRNEDFIINLKAELRRREIKTDSIVFTVASSRIANREARIPLCKENKILPLITENASDYFPVDMNQYHLVYNILGKVEDENGKQYRLSLLAVPNDVTTSYVDLAHSLNMHIKAMDYVGNSIYQVVRQEFAAGTNAVIKIDEHSSLITIVKEGEIVLQRSITHGVNAAIENMMELDLYGNDMTYEDATKAFIEHRCLRRYLNVDVDYQEEEDTNDEMMMSRIMITENLRYLIGNIGRIIEYYASRNENESIDNIALVGIGADFQGLDELLSNELGYPVKALEQVASVKIVSATAGDVSIRQIAACVGACIHPLQLLPKDLLKSEKQQSLVIPAAVMAAGIIIALALVIIGGILKSTAQSEKEDYQKKIDDAKFIKQVKEAYETTDAAHTQVMGFANRKINNNEQLVAFINELEEKMPTGFTALTVTASSTDVTLSVKCASKKEAAEICEQLRTFSAVSVLQISGISESTPTVEVSEDETEDAAAVTEEAAGELEVSFSIVCTYKDINGTDTETAEQ